SVVVGVGIVGVVGVVGGVVGGCVRPAPRAGQLRLRAETLLRDVCIAPALHPGDGMRTLLPGEEWTCDVRCETTLEGAMATCAIDGRPLARCANDLARSDSAATPESSFRRDR